MEDVGGLTLALLRVAAVHPQDIAARGERVLYASIGFFVCFFGIYGSLAFYAFFTRVGLRNVGSPAAGSAITLIASALVTLAIIVFDRSLVAYVNADLGSLKAHPRRGSQTPTESSEEYLHPLGRRSLKLFVGRMFVALLVSFFATQTIELYVFSGDIQSSRTEELMKQYQAELVVRQRSRSKAVAEYEHTRESLFSALEKKRSASIAARIRDHGYCGPGSHCFTRLNDSERISAEYAKLGEQNPISASSSDSLAEAKVKQEIGELQDHPTRVLAHLKGTLTDVSALYRYLWRKPLAASYYAAFTLLFISVDLAALLLKYFVASGSEYERRQAGEQRNRWREKADELRREAAAARLSEPEEQAERERAAAKRNAMAEVDEIARRAAQEALTRAYSRVADRQRVTEDAERFAMDDLAGRFQHSTQAFSDTRDSDRHERSTSAPAGAAANHPAGSPPSSNARRLHLDKDLVLPLLGAIAGIATIVYFLGGIYAYSQLKQVSLPTAALVDVSPRSMISSGVVIAVIGSIFSFGLIRILQALIRRFGPRPSLLSFVQLVWARIRAYVRRLLQDPPSSTGLSLRRAVSSPLTGGAAAAAAAGVASGLTDSGLEGAVLFGGTGVFLVFLGLQILGFFGLFGPDASLNRWSTLALIVVCVTTGAYEAGRLRPFRLPTAEIRFLGETECLEGGYLSQDPSNVYIADGRHRTLRVLPTKAIAGLLVSSRQVNVLTGSTRTSPCPKALMEPGP